ncbi:hypothetical protein NUW58_g3584 [Xylaria curta]|uniref:Uncharacterized protein n=1 Tax=Xylaria curta TaxID=42375 RepID=A0ACC1PAB8_9PEZI|nr:hypothetical protein NUW58_g3584 [Xylaria curta]
MVLRKKEVYTIITPIPSFIPRQLAIDILHSHGEVITLNPLVLSHKQIKAPRDAAADEYFSTCKSETSKDGKESKESKDTNSKAGTSTPPTGPSKSTSAAPPSAPTAPKAQASEGSRRSRSGKGAKQNSPAQRECRTC